MFRKSRSPARPTSIAPLDAVVERGQRRDRVVAVEPEVAREVVPRPERDADERDVLLDRDLGDGGERAVAAGHAEHVGAGRPRELLQVVSVLEEAHLDAARSCAASRSSSAVGESVPEPGLTIRNRCIGWGLAGPQR